MSFCHILQKLFGRWLGRVFLIYFMERYSRGILNKFSKYFRPFIFAERLYFCEFVFVEIIHEIECRHYSEMIIDIYFAMQMTSDNVHCDDYGDGFVKAFCRSYLTFIHLCV